MGRAPLGAPADITPSPPAALSGILPLDEFPLRLLATAGRADRGRATVTLTVGINAPPPAEAAALECILFDSGGLKEIASARVEAPIRASGWQDVPLALSAAPGSHVVRCGVHLRGSGRMAGVGGDVEVRK